MTDKPAENSQPSEDEKGQEEVDLAAVRQVLQRFERFRQFIVVCAECQADAPADWHYCANCGSRLTTECPGCGQPLPPYGGRFCPHCGLLVPRIAPAPDPSS